MSRWGTQTVVVSGTPSTVSYTDRSASAAGLVPGVQLVHKFGSNPLVDSNEAVRSIAIEGLSATGAQQGPVEIQTAGSSASSATVETWSRVQRAYVLTTGTYTTNGLTGSNAGNIVIETTGGTQLIAIAATRGQSQLCIYTVPLGYTAYLMHVDASVSASGGSTTATISMWQRRDILDTSAPVRARRLVETWVGVTSISDDRFNGSVSFPALTDIWLTAAKNGAGTASIEGSFQLELRPT